MFLWKTVQRPRYRRDGGIFKDDFNAYKVPNFSIQQGFD